MILSTKFYEDHKIKMGEMDVAWDIRNSCFSLKPKEKDHTEDSHITETARVRNGLGGRGLASSGSG